MAVGRTSATPTLCGPIMILAETLFGRSLATQEEAQEKVGPVTGIPMLGLDALSSAAYGPEETLTILLPLGTMGIAWIGPLTALILALLAVLPYSKFVHGIYRSAALLRHAIEQKKPGR